MSDVHEPGRTLPPIAGSSRVPWVDPTAVGSIPRRLDEVAARLPDAVAVLDGETRWTFADLRARANRVATDLVEALGPDPAPVAILMDLQAEVVPAVYGTLAARKFYVPLDPQAPPKRLRALLEDTGATVLLTNDRYARLARAHLPSDLRCLVTSRLTPPTRSDPPPVDIAPTDLAYLMYTSGSSGTPKGVTHTHENLLFDMWRQGRDLGTTPDDRYGLLFAASSSASCCSLFGGLLNGAAVSCFDLHRRPVSEVAGWLGRDRVTICDITVGVLRLLAAAVPPGRRIPHVRMVAPGGEPVYRHDVELCRRVFSDTCAVQNSLGTTETRTATQYFVTAEMPLDDAMVPIGWPVEEKQVVLLDDEGREADTGEIAVTSRYLATGYWERPDLTEAAFRPDPAVPGLQTYLTGDLGRRLPDGRLVHLGRRDSQVKIRGYRVEVAEVEDELLSVPGVDDAAVVPRSGDEGDTWLDAYVVLQADAGLGAEALAAACRDALPPASRPRTFHQVDALPQTRNGKLDRRALAGLAGTTLEAGRRAFEPPRTPLETTVCGIFERVLGLSRVSVSETFVELGGDSLRMLACLREIESETGVSLTPVEFFDAGAPAGVAERVASGVPDYEDLEI